LLATAHSFFEDHDMKRFCFVALLAIAVPVAIASVSAQTPPTPKSAPAKPAGAKAAAGTARTVEITGGDDMKFNVTEIAAKPGETLRIQLKNVGTLPKMAMAHNVVVLKPTTNLVEFNGAAATARDTNFIPPAMKAEVIAATELTGPGETVDVTFKVPAAAGTYPFMCTFPGHFTAGMKGNLVVK
jgi:azurin